MAIKDEVSNQEYIIYYKYIIISRPTAPAAVYRCSGPSPPPSAAGETATANRQPATSRPAAPAAVYRCSDSSPPPSAAGETVTDNRRPLVDPRHLQQYVAVQTLLRLHQQPVKRQLSIGNH